MMKSKILNALLILTSFVGYLEWGGGNHTFLFQAELEVLSKLLSDPMSAWHPFTVLPIAGQAILLGTLFQQKPGTWRTRIGIVCIAVLFLFMAFIGLLSLKLAIIGSTLPFLGVSMLTLWHHRKKD